MSIFSSMGDGSDTLVEVAVEDADFSSCSEPFSVESVVLELEREIEGEPVAREDLARRVQNLERTVAALQSRCADLEQDVEVVSTRLASVNAFLHGFISRLGQLFRVVINRLPTGF